MFRKLYWCEESPRAIYVSNLDGTYAMKLTNFASRPLATALYPQKG